MSKLLKWVAYLSIAAFSASAFAGPVNINTADADTLAAELKGVGSSLASAIVKDRERNGRYASAEDLARVRGIGMRLIENNREFIQIGELRDPAI